jgi:hypothetical protein
VKARKATKASSRKGAAKGRKKGGTRKKR